MRSWELSAAAPCRRGWRRCSRICGSVLGLVVGLGVDVLILGGVVLLVAVVGGRLRGGRRAVRVDGLVVVGALTACSGSATAKPAPYLLPLPASAEISDA